MKAQHNNIDEQNDSSLTAVFGDILEAEKAYSNALKRGYSKDDIDFFVPDHKENQPYSEPDELDTEIQEEKGKYVPLSTALGALLGIIAGIGFAVGIIIAGYFIGQLAGAITAGGISVIIGTLLGTTSSYTRDELYKPEEVKNNVGLRVNPHNNDDIQFFMKDWKTHKGKVIVASEY